MFRKICYNISVIKSYFSSSASFKQTIQLPLPNFTCFSLVKIKNSTCIVEHVKRNKASKFHQDPSSKATTIEFVNHYSTCQISNKHISYFPSKTTRFSCSNQVKNHVYTRSTFQVIYGVMQIRVCNHFNLGSRTTLTVR